LKNTGRLIIIRENKTSCLEKIPGGKLILGKEDSWRVRKRSDLMPVNSKIREEDVNILLEEILTNIT